MENIDILKTLVYNKTLKLRTNGKKELYVGKIQSYWRL
jgi:hypothetical protein